MDTLLTVKDVAHKLSLTEYTVREKIKKGEIKAIKKGKLWYVLLGDFEEYMRS